MDALTLIMGIITATLLAVAFFIFTNSRKAATRDIDSLPNNSFREEFSVELTPHGICQGESTSEPQSTDIPHYYGLDRLILMARDPDWLYAYWEVSATKKDCFNNEYGENSWEATGPVLRVYDITGINFDGSNANSYSDIALHENTDNWHIKVGKPNGTFCVDLGRMFPDGRFITLLRSNIVSTPRSSLSDLVDEEWMWIEGIYHTISRQVGVSSPLIIEEMEKRMKALPLNTFSPGFHMAEDNAEKGGAAHE